MSFITYDDEDKQDGEREEGYEPSLSNELHTLYRQRESDDIVISNHAYACESEIADFSYE